MKNKRKIELLAPARNADIAIAAIDHGADAVYMGASHHGARSQAGNSIDDIERVVEYAHRFNVRVYITLNTLVYDSELQEVKELIYDLYHVGVDALIVQDMALLEMDLPPIALHASTQCDIRTPEKARFLQDSGFSQLVLARELTLDEIKAIKDVTSVPLEAFVHGALCVSYSGNCQASYLLTGRSANRGECAQMCRLPYDLIDGKGKTIMSGAHLLSLKDMNRIDNLYDMICAGVDSFKIEGRLKDMEYIKTVVAAYRKELDRIISLHPDTLERSSIGKSDFSFMSSLNESFNRGYTEYFLNQRRPKVSMATFESPKSIGTKVGKVLKCDGKTLIVKSNDIFNNGDGFSYKAQDGTMRGFRINRADGNILILNSPLNIPPGTTLYRNLIQPTRQF
ncbi:MAG: U32 family peptidase [Muribaculaceae bacterium]|nr:U32 family peptidase [Muribaculaceae bacterium]